MPFPWRPSVRFQHVPGACVGRAPHTAGTGPNPAQLKAQMAALVLALAQTAKATPLRRHSGTSKPYRQLCRVFGGSPHWRKPSEPRKQHQRQPRRRSTDGIAEADRRPCVVPGLQRFL